MPRNELLNRLSTAVTFFAVRKWALISMLLIPWAMHSEAQQIDRDSIFQELAENLCSDSSFLKCSELDPLTCRKHMGATYAACANIRILATHPGPPLREQIQSGVLTCMFEYTSPLIDSDLDELANCYIHSE